MRYFIWILILVAGHGFSLLLTILGLIMFSLNAINTFEVCGTVCTVNINALPFYWSIFALGIVSSLVSAVLISSMLLSFGGLFSSNNKTSIFNKNRGNPSYK